MSESLRLWWFEMAPRVMPIAVAAVGLLLALILGWLLFRK
jgi:hypothetical protein